MSLAAYTRFRFLWGAADWQSGSGVPYASGQTANLGTNAVSPGIGARRAMLIFGRGTGVDPAVMHFDFVNMTSGSPDDSWTTGDFTALETAILAWWTTIKTMVGGGLSLQEIRWYRIGPGITPPNPVIRVLPVGVAATGAFGSVPPQVACSITFRTASRKSWGRSYLPIHAFAGSSDMSSGRFSNSYVDSVAGATNTLVTSAASSDFYLVVYSKTKNALLNVESVEVDNVPDVVRRRRWKTATYKKILP